MFKKIKIAFTMLVAVAVLVSCSITAPLNATSNPVGKKVGTSKSTVVLGLYFNQDHSIKEAAKNGGITKISTVDVKSTNVLFLYQTYETIVTGE